MDKTVLITGATSGLGRGVAEKLAAEGASVLVHGRDSKKIERAVQEVNAAAGFQADLSSLAEVRRLAEEVNGVDVLVNNAGVITEQREESADGIELGFAVNYLAGFLLTGLLQPKRVVNVASSGQAPLDFDDPQLERGWEAFRSYAQSKLAQITFTFELGERAPQISADALHPATLMDTNMVRQAFGRSMSTVDDGVGPVVELVTNSDGQGGRYFDQYTESRADAQAYDADARERLWQLSVELVGEDPYAR